MELEQKPPERPNFLLILILACATILVLFVLAYTFVRMNGRHLTFRHHQAEPTSRLILPTASNAVSVS